MCEFFTHFNYLLQKENKEIHPISRFTLASFPCFYPKNGGSLGGGGGCIYFHVYFIYIHTHYCSGLSSNSTSTLLSTTFLWPLLESHFHLGERKVDDKRGRSQKFRVIETMFKVTEHFFHVVEPCSTTTWSREPVYIRL